MTLSSVIPLFSTVIDHSRKGRTGDRIASSLVGCRKLKTLFEFTFEMQWHIPKIKLYILKINIKLFRLAYIWSDVSYSLNETGVTVIRNGVAMRMIPSASSALLLPKEQNTNVSDTLTDCSCTCMIETQWKSFRVKFQSIYPNQIVIRI